MQTISRKVTLYPVGDKEEVNRVYKYLRDGIKNQNLAMNEYISALYVGMITDISKEDRKELNHLYSRMSNSKKGSAYESDIILAEGLPIGALQQKVQSDFSTSMKKGLRYGRVSLPTYRDTNPLYIHRDYVRLMRTNPHLKNGIYHKYENDDEFIKHLCKEDLEVFIKFANGITFKVNFGNPHRSAELRSVFKNIFDETYDVQGSSIQITDNGKIILNLTLNIPDKEAKLDENVIVGVDIGLAIPAVCALNTNEYIKKSIGNIKDFLRVRTKIQSQRKRLQKNLAITSGGHGRTKKLKTLEKYSDYESNFVRTYNHFVSKNVVDFAVKNGAKYINIEDLSGFGENKKNKFVLRNWSYYQLQQDIAYKAAQYGIIVRKVNPYHTSQICSCCGHWEDGQRVSQSEFICKSKDCKNFGKTVNADYNAARNISMATEFTEIYDNGKWIDLAKKK